MKFSPPNHLEDLDMNSTLRKYFSSLRKIIKEALPNEDGCQFLEGIDILRNKSRSKRINIAVIGEFNSGKSTFINALLRERILKEAGRPTTAAATYITKSTPRNLLQFFLGSKTYVSIGFDDGQKFECTNNNYSRCSDYISQSYGVQTNGLGDLISTVTAEQQVAKHVVELKLELKTTGLPKDIVIIDTPGFNPGGLDFENHLQITENVVANIADMAIILTPSTQPMSRTLMDFLETNIGRYLHRCVFIVTKIDLISETERDSVYEYIFNQISQFGIQSPKVFGISARTVLPVKNIPESMKADWPIYQNEFCNVEKILWCDLAKYKNITILEHIYHLLEDLSDKIKIYINTNTEKLHNTLRILENNNITRIEELTDVLYKGACSSIDRFYACVSFLTDSYKNYAINSCRSIIRSGGRLRHYRDNEAPAINVKVRDQAFQFTSYVKNQIEGSQKILSNEISKFREAFHSHYKDMPSLEPQINFDINNVDMGYEAIDLSISESLNNENFLGRTLRNFSNLFRPETEIQDEVISEVSGAIEMHFISLEGNVRNSVEKIKDGQKRHLKNYCDAHISTYGKQVEILIKQQTEEKNKIEKNISVNNANADKLQELQNRIQAELSNLLSQ